VNSIERDGSAQVQTAKVFFDKSLPRVKGMGHSSMGKCALAANNKRYFAVFLQAFAFAWLAIGAAQAHDESKLAKEMPSALEGEENSADEFETKHVFGFTEGTDVGDAGDREAEFTTSAGIGKQVGGRYGAVEQLATYEAAPTNRFGYELNLHGVAQTIGNVPGLSNLNQATFSGLSVAPKYIFLRRGVDAPFGLAVSIEPEFDRIDPVVGAHSRNVLAATRVYLDSEVIEKKLYFGANLVFSPEVDSEVGSGISQYALFGATGALTYRITPKFAVGGEIEHYEVYNSLGFANRTGSGTYIGPTVIYQFTPKLFAAAAWSSQIAGRPADASANALALYNQSDIARQRARLVVGVQF
jgi:hypothetical protein